MTDSTKQKQRTAGQSMRSTMNALVESAKPATSLTEQPLSIPSNDEIEASLVDAVRWTISVEVAGQGYRSADVIGNLKKTVKRTMQEQGYPQVSTPFVQEKQVRVPPFMFD